MTVRVLPALLLASCTWISVDDLAGREDLDGDGVNWTVDCDDDDPNHAVVQIWFLDGDGHGNSIPVEHCSPPGAGWVESGLDCDDSNDAVNPDSAEICNTVDDDCDGLVDDGDDVSSAEGSGLSAWYPDADAVWPNVVQCRPTCSTVP